MFDLIFFIESLITIANRRPITNWRKQYFQSPCKVKWSKWFVALEHDYADTVEHLCSSVQEYLIYSLIYKCFFKKSNFCIIFVYSMQGFEPNLIPLSENLTNYSGKKYLEQIQYKCIKYLMKSEHFNERIFNCLSCMNGAKDFFLLFGCQLYWELHKKTFEYLKIQIEIGDRMDWISVTF